MATVTLPAGWRVIEYNETVPNPNEGSTPNGYPFFTRRTFTCLDDNDKWTCASGSQDDCYAQALSVAQSRGWRGQQ